MILRTLLQIGGDSLSTRLGSNDVSIDTIIYFFAGLAGVALLIYALTYNEKKRSTKAKNEGTNQGKNVKVPVREIRPTREPATNKGTQKAKDSGATGELNPIKDKPSGEKTPGVTGETTNTPTQRKEGPPNVRYINYQPVTTFKQSEPLCFPYVQMPRAGSVFIAPQKGTYGRKGHKEEEFKTHLNRYFYENITVLDDRRLVTDEMKYTPDFCLVYDPKGKNIVIDIEIDEPYEGKKDIAKRKPTHFQFADTNRNNAFTDRGWVVIRFAEIQVHQAPDSCCRFIAEVLKSLDSFYVIPISLEFAAGVSTIKQWTEAEAKVMSLQRHRENYLGILDFGVTSRQSGPEEEITDNNSGEAFVTKSEPVDIPKDPGTSTVKEGPSDSPAPPKGDTQKAAVKKDPPKPAPPQDKTPKASSPGKEILNTNTRNVIPPAGNKLEVLNWAIRNNLYLSFTFRDARTHTIKLYRPHSIAQGFLQGYCQEEKRPISYFISHIDNITVKEPI